MYRRPPERTSSLWSILRQFSPVIPAVAGLGLISSFLDGAGVALFFPMLTLLIPGQRTSNLPAPLREFIANFQGSDPRTLVVLFTAAIFSLIVLKAICQAASSSLAASVQGRIARRIRQHLARSLSSVDFPFFIQADNNRLTHIVTTDSWLVIDALQSTLSLIPALAGLIVILAMLAWLNAKLFLLVVAAAAVMQLILGIVEARQENLSFDFTAATRRLWGRHLTLVQAPRVIRLFGQQQRELQAASDSIEELRKVAVRSQVLRALASPMTDMMVALIFIAVLAIGYRSGMSIAEITVFLLLLTRAQPHVKVLVSAKLNIRSLWSSFEEVDWLLSRQVQTSDTSDQNARIPINQEIVLDNVSYDYPDGTRALHSVSLAISPGVPTAIIGESGSGKSTLVNLFCGLMSPRIGEIRLGPRPLRELDLDAWRRSIGVAGQESELISGTIEENICYARPDATTQELEDAARTSGADEFISTLSLGYKTPVGPSGLSLSGGQRQRIGLARALLRRPDLLILDEATNAVDAITERDILRLISEGRYFKTLLIVSHRASTISLCKQGIVLRGGTVTESGPLETLAYFQTMLGSSGVSSPT